VLGKRFDHEAIEERGLLDLTGVAGAGPSPQIGTRPGKAGRLFFLFQSNSLLFMDARRRERNRACERHETLWSE